MSVFYIGAMYAFEDICIKNFVSKNLNWISFFVVSTKHLTIYTEEVKEKKK